MPNASYPDDDGSRTPSGPHDEGRQRVSIYPTERVLTPATVADHRSGSGFTNARTDSSGDQQVPNGGWAVDGRASAGSAGYPPKPEDPNSRD